LIGKESGILVGKFIHYFEEPGEFGQSSEQVSVTQVFWKMKTILGTVQPQTSSQSKIKPLRVTNLLYIYPFGVSK